ncbi:hypothetical protein [Streptomyces sp. NPDC056296]|uniref:hypothetical protein n=1 Tax=Streptomyces sp. NPDC056296 TaxID=3345775 RepID=UPI0035E1113D
MTLVADPRPAEAWNGPGVDISAPLLERARASTAAEGIENAAYVCAETVWGRDVRDAVEFLLSRVPGGALPASRLAGPEEVLRPFDTGTGVRLRAGVWLVTAVRP